MSSNESDETKSANCSNCKKLYDLIETIHKVIPGNKHVYCDWGKYNASSLLLDLDRLIINYMNKHFPDKSLAKSSDDSGYSFMDAKQELLDTNDSSN